MQYHSYAHSMTMIQKCFDSYSFCNCFLVNQTVTSYPIIGVGSNSILGRLNVLYTTITAIYAACMNINKVSRVKYWGEGALAPPAPWFLRLCLRLVTILRIPTCRAALYQNIFLHVCLPWMCVTMKSASLATASANKNTWKLEFDTCLQERRPSICSLTY